MKKSKINRFAVSSLQLAVILLLIGGQAWALTKKFEGTTLIEDAMIASASPDNNYGDMGNDDIEISPTKFMIIRVLNLASEIGPDATLSAGVCSIYCMMEVGGAKTIRAGQVLKPWVEGTQSGGTNEPGVTWNDWDNDDWEWTTAGCGCANDDGVDNSSDNGACDDPSRRDRKATQQSSQSVNATGWFVWSISAALCQAWYDGTSNENGILIYTSSSGSSLWRGSENSLGFQPHFTFTYTTDGEEADKPRKNIMSGGILK